jgi:hypothetical protein
LRKEALRASREKARWLGRWRLSLVQDAGRDGHEMRLAGHDEPFVLANDSFFGRQGGSPAGARRQ